MKKKFLISLILMLMLLCNIKVYAADEQVEIPSKYDLRNVININVENQGQRNWCYNYAWTKMVQTYIQMHGGKNYNLSEAYLTYADIPYFGGSNSHIVDNIGARDWSAPLTKLRGIYVLEKDFPNKDYSFTEQSLNLFNNAKPIVKRVNDETYTNASAEEIKKYIINNGAITAGIMLNGNIIDDTGNQPHAIVIIGWDDNYSKNNFSSNNRPENDGAWLILNSWGSNWGNNGTAWVSYEDNNILNMQVIGIENITFMGELNAEFSYEYNETNNTITAIIKTDDKLEDIEGWSKYSEEKYIKKIEEPFEPYSITLKSKIDGATKVIEINIPNEVFEKQKTVFERREKAQEQKKEETILEKIVYFLQGLRSTTRFRLFYNVYSNIYYLTCFNRNYMFSYKDKK